MISILDDTTPALQPTPKFIAKSMLLHAFIKDQRYQRYQKRSKISKIKDFGNWLLDYIPPKRKEVDEALDSFKNLIKNCTTRETLHSN